MNAAGAIDLVCERRGSRSVLARAHHAGLARTSRLPPERDGAARVMTATLGPGVLRGDRFVTTGRVGAHAALVATAQMATPVYAGAPAVLDARWEIAEGATLCLVGSPLLPQPGCTVTLELRLDVRGSGLAIAADTLVVAPGATVRGRTAGTLDGRIVLRDAIALQPGGTSSGAIGSVYAIAADPRLRARLTDAAWSFLDGANEVRGGAGGCDGAVVVRLAGGAFAVGEATAALAERWRALSAAGAPP